VQKLSYEKSARKILVKLTPGGSMVPRFGLQLLFSEKLLKTQQPLKQEKRISRYVILEIF
jgi:hypothetical protein